MTDEVQLLKAIADPTRLRIMGLLARSGELCVCQVQGALGESQFKISRHLKILRMAGWLSERRGGRWVHYAALPAQSPFHRELYAALAALSLESLQLAVELDQIDALKRNEPYKE